MHYRLHASEDIERQLRELILEQADRALAVLGDGDMPRSDGIHEARRCCKRARAALRLVRSSVGDGQYGLLNAAFRDASQLMSAQRDHASLVKTLDELQEKLTATGIPHGPPLELAAERLRHWLVTAPEAMPEAVPRDEAEMQRLIAASLRALEQAREAARQLQLNAVGFEALSPGLERTLRRGQKAYRKFKREPTAGRLHQWRKRAKDAEFQYQLLRRLEPRRMKQWQQRWSELGSLLGDARDLSRLDAAAARALEAHALASPALGKALSRGAVGLREQLLCQALKLGGKLHRHPPASSIKHFANLWRAQTQ